MVVFDSPTLLAGNGLISSKTLASTSKSMSVTNYSHYFLNVESDTSNGYGILPPFTTQTFAVRPGQSVTFTCNSNSISAQAQTSETVSYSESTFEFATGLQSLSIPVYSQTVVSLKLKNDPTSGFLPFSAASQFHKFTNECVVFEFFNTDNSNRVGYINFNQPTGDQSRDYPLYPGANRVGAYYQCTADYPGFYYQGADMQVMGWYEP